MNRLIKLSFFFGTLLFTYACTNLDEVLEDELTTQFSDNGVTVIEGATSGGILPSGNLVGAYNGIRNGSAGHGSFFSVQTVSSDEMAIGQKGGDWFDGGIWLQMHRHTFDAAHPALNDTWNNAYGGIGQANLALAGTLSPNEAAQARVIRAFQHFRLMDLFGRIKIITASGTDAPQTSRLAAFNFVESELLAVLGITAVSPAMDLSSSALGTEAQPYVVNQFAALSLLAKLYLNAEVYSGTARFNEADIAATYVIDNGPYTLSTAAVSVPNLAKRPEVASDPASLTGYAAIFAPNNQFNPEMIWSIYYDAVSAGGMNFSQMNFHYSTQLTYALDEQPWNGYQVLEEFYNSYEATDVRKEANFLVGPQTDFGGNALLDFAADDPNLVVDYTPGISQLQPNSPRESGARAKKFSFQLFGRPDMNNDYPIFRLGDLHLMRGEAKARAAGNWSLSLPDVNAIRNRAGLTTPLGTITADIFFAERGREMFQETSRRTDLIRFGKWSNSWWEKTNSDAFRTIFPIPFAQIQSVGSGLTQNPGY
jgi:hypothetical protein